MASNPTAYESKKYQRKVSKFNLITKKRRALGEEGLTLVADFEAEIDRLGGSLDPSKRRKIFSNLADLRLFTNPLNIENPANGN